MKAFPNGMITDDKGMIVSSQPGMDLRDYFAAKAMPHCQLLLRNWDDYFSSDTAEVVAKMAYVMADEMMKGREAK